MPRKRNKTPPPSDDEPRFFTVHYPYPINANMELDSDRKNMILWLACCTGKDPLAALYHKPRSGNMVIIEVNRSFTDTDKLLGRHNWADFLKNPSDEEKERYSSVFHCTMNSVREVSKTGWKRVVVEENWFSVWTPQNHIVVDPYPPTTYCPTPVEAQTGRPLCRPLPVAKFPPPPPPDSLPPPPAVGSKEWIAMKDAGFTPEPPKNAWAKGSSKAKAASSSKSAPNAWKKGSALVPAGSVTPRDLQLGSTGPVPANIPYARSSIANTAFGSSEWPSTPDLIPSSLSRVKSPTLDSASSLDSQSIGTPLDQPQTAYIESEHFEQVMTNVLTEDWGEEYEDDVWATPAPGVISEVQAEEGPAENLWVDYGKFDDEKKEEDLCPVHGKLCRKGICADYAQRKRMKNREEEQQKRQKEREKKAAARMKKNKDGKGDDNGPPSNQKFKYMLKKPEHLSASGPWTADKATQGSSTPENGATKKKGAKGEPKAETITPDDVAAPPAPQAPSDTGAAPTPAPAAPRPARGRKMNTANQKKTVPVKQAPPPITSDPPPADQKSISGDSGWGNTKAYWDPPTPAPSVAAASNTGGWGKVQKAPWDASSKVESVVDGEEGGGRAPSVVASSAGNSGWGAIPKAPWDAESNAGSGGGGGKGKKGSKKKAPSSVAASSTGGWGPVPKAYWDGPSSRAPSVVGDDDDTKTVNGDGAERADAALKWNNSREDAIDKSWADQVEDEKFGAGW